MTRDKVIVFGPTGNVGAIAAITAAQRGAQVFLAMRDTSKPITGINAEDEKSGSFERIKADLTNPESVLAAVKSTGAKRAFIYLAHESSDFMRSTIEALKAGGIEFVVFLSAATIEGDPASVSPNAVIQFLHAQVELNLKAVFGVKGYAAIRAGGFATNALGWWGKGIKEGEVRMLAPDCRLDWVTPHDMGVVSGAVLATGLTTDDSVILVLGPQLMSIERAFKMLSHDVLQKDVRLTIIDEETAKQDLINSGTPPPLAQNLVDELKRLSTAGSSFVSEERHRDAVQKVSSYTGRPGVTFEEWARENKDLFL